MDEQFFDLFKEINFEEQVFFKKKVAIKRLWEDDINIFSIFFKNIIESNLNKKAFLDKGKKVEIEEQKLI